MSRVSHIMSLLQKLVNRDTHWKLENLSEQAKENAVYLLYSESKLAGTWRYEENEFDSQIWFYCPICGVGWRYVLGAGWTREFTIIDELPPQWMLLNCFESRGCGNECIVIFDRKVE
jgi:hypothetical protein